MLYKISLKAPYTQSPIIAQRFEDAGFDGICEFEDDTSPPSDKLDDNGFHVASIFTVDAYTDENISAEVVQSMVDDIPNVTDIVVELVNNQDWLQLCYRNFPPQIIPPFFIYGSYDPDVVIPSDAIALKIDAATAFGSGEHQTTRGCLQLMASLSNQSTIKQVIDMGCGSGVLAIAAAKLFSANVIAVDIDDEAVIVTQRNCQQNNIDDIVTFRSDGFDNVYFTDDLQVDLIVANILATPLIFMAASMKKYLKSNGMAVLSGLLTRQKADVVNAYSEQGFDLVREVVIDDWCALLIQKK